MASEGGQSSHGRDDAYGCLPVARRRRERRDYLSFGPIICLGLRVVQQASLSGGTLSLLSPVLGKRVDYRRSLPLFRQVDRWLLQAAGGGRDSISSSGEAETEPRDPRGKNLTNGTIRPGDYKNAYVAEPPTTLTQGLPKK